MIITVALSDIDAQCLENDLCDMSGRVTSAEGIAAAWLQGALNGKINSCKKRVLQNWRDAVQYDSSQPQITTEEQLLAAIFALPDYKTRYERELHMREE